MSDSRFHFKGVFSIYGKDFPLDCSLNWCASPGEIDRRITEFFLESHDQAYSAYVAESEKLHLADKEEDERRELARLFEKYPDAKP